MERAAAADEPQRRAGLAAALAYEGARVKRWVRSGAARAAGAVFAITLAVYWATMNRTIGFIDRGELAAAAVTFGIPHPTGYPTLMMLAGLVVKLSPLRPVLTLNALG